MPTAAPKNPDSICLVAPIELAAPAAGAGLPTKFAGTAYSGGVAPSYGVVIDVASTAVPPKMPLLAEHDRADIAGLIDGASVGDNAIRVSGSLFSDMPGSSAERLAQVSQRGVPLQMSVGLYGFTEEWIPQGQSTTVNGQSFAGPVTVLRNGTVREVSLCTLGADWNADVRLFSQPDAAAAAAPKDSAMTDAEAQALRDQLAAANAETERLRTESAAAVTAANAAALAERNGAITALFAETGTKEDADQRTALASLEPKLFSSMAAAMRAAAGKLRALSPTLFADQATGESAATKTAGDAAKEAARQRHLDPTQVYGLRAAERAKSLAERGGAFGT